MTLEFMSDYRITPFRADDENNLVRYLNEKNISRNSLYIPYPYTHTNAREWITFSKENRDPLTGLYLHCAIRNKNDQIIGGIGFQREKEPFLQHLAGLGYWLAKHLWNQGIMTQAVKAFTSFGFEKLQLSKINAYIFPSNIASEKVLKKAGFTREGYLKSHYYLDGKFRDTKLFSLLKE